MRRAAGQRGQTASEYMGVLLVVSLLVAAVVATNPGQAISAAVGRIICQIGDGHDCAVQTASVNTSDRDGDGLSNRAERQAGTDPGSADSDGDGISDGKERRLGTDPLAGDTDGDGISDDREAASGGKLDPTKGDTDSDGLSDGEELAIGTNPADPDSDGAYGDLGDGLTDAQEIEIGSDPTQYDSDGDGNPDGYEVDRGDDPTSDDRSFIQKGFDSFVLDDPIGFIVTLGAGKLASGTVKVLAGRIKVLAKALRDAKTVEEAARIRRQIIGAIREKLGRYVPGSSAGRVPQGITRSQFDDMSQLVREQAGSISSDIRIQGSRAAGTARPDSDIDIAVLVDDAEFETYLERGYGRPNPNSSKERGLNHARANGKIASGEAKLSPLRKELERRLGHKVDISIIRRGGPFDQGPYIPLR